VGMRTRLSRLDPIVTAVGCEPDQSGGTEGSMETTFEQTYYARFFKKALECNAADEAFLKECGIAIPGWDEEENEDD
jgi:hypothetical protein